jgi:hypothetical protein
MEKSGKDMIPEQHVGNKLDAVHEYKASSDHEAKQVFNLAAARMLDVNSWEKICGPLSAKFKLTDEDGQPISRDVKPGDHFRIDIPGPGPSSGDGFDWVQVEALEDKRNPSGNEESVTVRVRPSASPSNDNSDTAHFFKEYATSSFRVVRNGSIVRAEVHGRNEVPNTKVETTTDQIRNAVVGAGAVAGAAKPQWKSLVKGLLQKP